MKRNDKKLYIYLIIIVFFCVSFGYAVLNSTLNINGTSNIEKNTWDIYFDNVVIKDESVDAVKIPTIDSKTTVNFEVELNLPGDFYEFTVDVVNNGTIDAMIDSVEKTSDLTAEQQKYLNYVIEYQNGEQIKSKQLIKKEEFVRLKVRVEYKKDIIASDLPQNAETLNLGFTVNYIQSDGTGSTVTDNGAWVVKANGSLDEIGTVVTIGTEQFYTIGTEGDNVKLLSMYNLYVGNRVDEDDNVTPLVSPTGKQSELAKGYEYDSVNGTRKYPYIGTTAFSSDVQKGTEYNDYVGSIVEGYVNSYKVILEVEYGVDVVEARLITKDELTNSETFACEELGCCPDKYPWIYSTTYWSGSAFAITNIVWNVNSDGIFSNMQYSSYRTAGVRPVIVIPKSEVKVDVKPVANGDINELGTIVTIGTEQFYTLGIDGNNVKMISMYNLYVGGYKDFEQGKWVPYGDEATGMQAADMIGYVTGENIQKGIIPFSNYEHHGEYSGDYLGSLVEYYTNNYKEKLEKNFGVEILEARGISKNELENSETFACSMGSFCSDKYPWIYKTSYWTESKNTSTYVFGVFSHGTFNAFQTELDSSFGVRPVVVISKEYFE